MKTYRGTAPYILADYILFIDSSNSLVACSVHGTNLPSENQYDGFWESCGVEPQAKDFKSFLCKIAVSVRRRLHRNATTGRSPCTPVFPGRQRSFPPSERGGTREFPTLLWTVWAHCPGEGDGTRTHTPFRATTDLANRSLTS